MSYTNKHIMFGLQKYKQLCNMVHHAETDANFLQYKEKKIPYLNDRTKHSISQL